MLIFFHLPNQTRISAVILAFDSPHPDKYHHPVRVSFHSLVYYIASIYKCCECYYDSIASCFSLWYVKICEGIYVLICASVCV